MVHTQNLLSIFTEKVLTMVNEVQY